MSWKSRGDDLGNCHERMNDDHRQLLVNDSDRGVEMKKEKTNHSTLPSIHLNLKSFVYPKVGFPFPSQSKGDDQAKGDQRRLKGISGPLVLLTPTWVAERQYVALILQWKGVVGGGAVLINC
jgi:hypothetical protein